MSNTITGKVDEMGNIFKIYFIYVIQGKKIDEIEKSLVELMEDIKIDENEDD